MVNKNIKRMLLFVTLCILLIGIVSATDTEVEENFDMDDNLFEKTAVSTETISEVNTEVTTDNNENDNTVMENKIIDKKSISHLKEDYGYIDYTNKYGSITTTRQVSLSINYFPTRIYPGDTFSVSAHAVGDNRISVPGGDITFSFNGQQATRSIISGTASCSFKAPQRSGTYSLSARFMGYSLPATRYATASASQSITIGDTSPSYSPSSSSSSSGSSSSYSGSSSSYSGSTTKYKTNLYLNYIDDVNLGDNVKINGSLSGGNLDIHGISTTVSININGQTYTAGTDIYGRFSYNYKTTQLGTNKVTVTYPGSLTYQSSSASKTFYVNPVGPKYTYITLNNINEVTIGQTTTISGYYYYESNVPLTLTTMRLNINGKTYTNKTDNKGYFTYSYKTTKDGSNTVTVSYPGNNNFKSAMATKTFNVKSVGSQYTYITLNNIQEVAYGGYTTISGYYYYGNNIPLTLTTMRLNINGKHVTSKTDNKGYFTYSYKTERVGKNTVTVSYPGNNNFKSATTTKTFNVKITSPIYTYITLNSIKEVNNGQYTTISGHYYYSNNIPLTSTNMRININGKTYTAKTDNNGYFTYIYKTTKDGSNTVTVSYPGNTNFQSASSSKTFNVKSNGPQYTYIKLYDLYDAEFDSYAYISGYYYYGNDIPLTYTPMSINVNGEKYTAKTDNEGYFYYYYDVTKVGKKTVNVSYHGNNNFKAASATKSFNVKISSPIYTYVDLYDVSDVKMGEYITIRGYYKYRYGNPLTQTTMTININGKKYYAKTDNSGYFRYDYKTTKSGTNTVTVSYPGNSNFQSASEYTTFNVKATKKSTVLTVSVPDQGIEGDLCRFGGYLKDANGNPLKLTTVTVNCNGYKINTKTDKYGSYYIATTSAKRGTNTVTVSYAGNDNYYGTSITKTFNAIASGTRSGDIVMVGSKNFLHYGCGGHVIYNGNDGYCNRCGAEFYQDYVIN